MQLAPAVILAMGRECSWTVNLEESGCSYLGVIGEEIYSVIYTNTLPPKRCFFFLFLGEFKDQARSWWPYVVKELQFRTSQAFCMKPFS